MCSVMRFPDQNSRQQHSSGSVLELPSWVLIRDSAMVRFRSRSLNSLIKDAQCLGAGDLGLLFIKNNSSALCMAPLVRKWHMQ